MFSFLLNKKNIGEKKKINNLSIKTAESELDFRKKIVDLFNEIESKVLKDNENQIVYIAVKSIILKFFKYESTIDKKFFNNHFEIHNDFQLFVEKNKYYKKKNLINLDYVENQKNLTNKKILLSKIQELKSILFSGYLGTPYEFFLREKCDYKIFFKNDNEELFLNDYAFIPFNGYFFHGAGKNLNYDEKYLNLIILEFYEVFQKKDIGININLNKQDFLTFLFKHADNFLKKFNSVYLSKKDIFKKNKPKSLLISRFYDFESIAMLKISKELNIRTEIIQKGSSAGGLDENFLNLHKYSLEPDVYHCIDEKESNFIKNKSKIKLLNIKKTSPATEKSCLIILQRENIFSSKIINFLEQNLNNYKFTIRQHPQFYINEKILSITLRNFFPDIDFEVDHMNDYILQKIQKYNIVASEFSTALQYCKLKNIKYLKL